MGSAIGIHSRWLRLAAVSSLLFGTSRAQTGTPTAAPADNTTMAPTIFELPECFTNTTLLFEAQERKDPFVEQKYIICPNTVMNIGDFDQNFDCCVDGDFSLFVRSRSIIQCGEDGSSANNCTLVGGNTQMFSLGSIYSDVFSTGMIVRGLTFQSADFTSVSLLQQGDITFEDCIFKDHSSPAIVFISFEAVREVERRLTDVIMDGADLDMDDPYALPRFWMRRDTQEKYYQKVLASTEKYRNGEASLVTTGDDRRRLQGPGTQTSTFDNCQLIDSRQGSTTQGGFPVFGIVAIMAPFNPTIFRNTVFRNNDFSGKDGNVAEGYGILSIGSRLEVTDTCFIDNNFTGFGPVQVFGGADFEFTNNFVSRDDAVFCDFAAVATVVTPQSSADVSCLTSDLDACPGAPTSAPTSAPSDTPTSSPSGAPERVGGSWSSLHLCLVAVVSLLLTSRM